MNRFFPAALLAAAAIASPAMGEQRGDAASPAQFQKVTQPQMTRMPTNAELLQAIDNLTDQVKQLRDELSDTRSKLSDLQSRESDDYQKTNWRIVQTCKLAYLRSFKAGDNPSSGQGGNPYLPMDWCDIGSYPYWKSVQ